MRTPLADRVAERIAREGPIDVAAFMDACLNDPEHGYYRVHPALGASGDFITAPLVSQMFGELLGLWAAEVWVQLGRPSLVRLVELGPGDGTLMADVLRAARTLPDFAAAADVVMVETSEPLRARQADALVGVRVRWTDNLAGVGGEGPVIILANEFLDCLPIRQAVRCAGAWRERRIGIGPDGGLRFVAGEAAPGPPAPDGAVREWSPALEAMGAVLGTMMVRFSGAALFIDYGGSHPSFGDTLQALRGHTKQSPLDNPGQADLTAQVDFAAFLAATRDAGARTAGPVTQAEFLTDLGIEARAAALCEANPESAHTIGRQLSRLTAPDQMGALFKAACIHGPGVSPAGFAAS